jgi:hypothetical protein
VPIGAQGCADVATEPLLGGDPGLGGRVRSATRRVRRRRSEGASGRIRAIGRSAPDRLAEFALVCRVASVILAVTVGVRT